MEKLITKYKERIKELKAQREVLSNLYDYDRIDTKIKLLEEVIDDLLNTIIK